MPVKQCPHDYEGSSKCVYCGHRLRCDECHMYVREDNLNAHAKKHDKPPQRWVY